MQHILRRWHEDHREELHVSWLNGAGIVYWEIFSGLFILGMRPTRQSCVPCGQSLPADGLGAARPRRARDCPSGAETGKTLRTRVEFLLLGVT